MSITFTVRIDSGSSITLPADATEQDIVTAFLDKWPDLADHRMNQIRRMAYLISTDTGDHNTGKETAWEIAYNDFGMYLSY